MEDNYLKIEVLSKDINVLPVRMVVTSFLSQENIHIDEIMDIKTALSEAVTNSVEHAYDTMGKIVVEVSIRDEKIEIKVKDFGKGIEDISLALTPAYTSKPETEHAGLGFTIMESFMDELIVDSKVNEGTTITLTKKIKKIKSNGSDEK